MRNIIRRILLEELTKNELLRKIEKSVYSFNYKKFGLFDLGVRNLFIYDGVFYLTPDLIIDRGSPIKNMDSMERHILMLKINDELLQHIKKDVPIDGEMQTTFFETMRYKK